jgi:hypothetical protein
MADADPEVVRLLTEIRDAIRADAELRRRVVEESRELGERSVRWQRIAVLGGALTLLALFVTIALVAWLKG